MWLLYQAAVGAVLLLAGPILLWRRGSHYLSSLRERLGLEETVGKSAPVPTSSSPLWIHAVSVGEAGVAATLARALPADLPLLVTTVTPTGQARARSAFAGRATVAYLPFELGFAVNRFVRRYRPRALVCVEGDLWPLVLRALKQRGVPAVVVNGRVSDRSFRRMRRLRRLLGPIFDPIGRFGVQTEEDRRRLLDLGVPAERVTVTGNLKFETPAAEPRPALVETLRDLAAGRPILVAGSTMAGEDEAVLDAWSRAGAGRTSLLVLAPRHPERWPAVAALLARRGLAAVRRSALETLPLKGASRLSADLVLLDSLGELAGLYATALGAFVGGTLVPTGGHNPLEPAASGVAVAAGPSMENFREIAAAFDEERAWRRVGNAAELGEAFREWIEEPEAARALGQRGRALLAARRGALQRTMDLLAPVVSPSPTGRESG